MLKDTFGRTFPYIRLSISDVCNFKCGYCLPNGYKIDKSDNRTFITKEEIGRLAKALSELGVSKIRITGGEPTVRNDFLDIIKIIKKNSGIKKTVITTNGYHLNRIADDLNESGLDFKHGTGEIYPSPKTDDASKNLYKVRAIDMRIAFVSEKPFFRFERGQGNPRQLSGFSRDIKSYTDRNLRDSVVVTVHTRNVVEKNIY